MEFWNIIKISDLKKNLYFMKIKIYNMIFLAG